MFRVIARTTSTSIVSLVELEQANVCNWTRTHNHLVLKRTLNHLANIFIYEEANYIEDYMKAFQRKSRKGTTLRNIKHLLENNHRNRTEHQVS